MEVAVGVHRHECALNLHYGMMELHKLIKWGAFLVWLNLEHVTMLLFGHSH